jgi:hypothetical protein
MTAGTFHATNLDTRECQPYLHVVRGDGPERGAAHVEAPLRVEDGLVPRGVPGVAVRAVVLGSVRDHDGGEVEEEEQEEHRRHPLQEVEVQRDAWPELHPEVPRADVERVRAQAPGALHARMPFIAVLDVAVQVECESKLGKPVFHSIHFIYKPGAFTLWVNWIGLVQPPYLQRLLHRRGDVLSLLAGGRTLG